MATLTITYDGRSKVAQSHISQSQEEAKDREWTAEEERQAFLCTSKNNMARWLNENKI